jgi:hypothetical protein
MIANATQGRIRSVLGEHLIVSLIVAMVAVAGLAGYPALKASTEGTAAREQVRVNMPFVAAAALESGSSAQSTSPSSP